MMRYTACPTYLVTALIWGLVLLGGAQGGVLYVDNHSSGGSTFWPNIHFPTIQSAINSSQAGDEIWVRKGTYIENILLDGSGAGNGVALFGGFSGSEVQISERILNLSTETIIDGGGAGVVVQISGCTDSKTCVDGFTIRNGYLPSGNGAG